jgi:hypothetical protein
LPGSAQTAGLERSVAATRTTPRRCNREFEGLYLSRDSGGHFAPVASGAEGLAVFFDLDGKRLWYSAFDGQPRLAHVPLGGGAATQVKLPSLSEDAVGYIAQTPAARSEYAIASFGKSIYLSKDSGRSWSQIADRGKAK